MSDHSGWPSMSGPQGPLSRDGGRGRLQVLWSGVGVGVGRLHPASQGWFLWAWCPCSVNTLKCERVCRSWGLLGLSRTPFLFGNVAH